MRWIPSKIIRILPARLAYCNRMIDQILQDQPQIRAYFNHFASQIESGLNDVLNANSSMMQTIQGIINNITVQLIEVFSVFKNMFLGFLIAVYLLASRKLFGAQARLLLYGIFPNKWAAIIEEEFRYTDKMFNGFFVGKIIDSAIIGVICFAGTTSKKMATDLLKKGRTNVKGMWSEKKQTTYDAAVILNDTGGKYINFKLEFPKRKVGADGRK